MAAYFVTSIVEGQWFYVTDASPDTVISAPRGSVAIRTDAGNESLWLNVTAGNSPGTNWERILSPNINGDIDLTGVDQLTLADNANPALTIGSAGLLNLLEFRTTNGAERIDYNGAATFRIISGGLDVNAGGVTIFAGGLSVNAGAVTLPEASLNVASATTDAADGAVSASLALRKTYGAGIGPTAVALPARVGGWRVVDAYIVANGGGGSLQVFNGVNPVTDAMAEGGATSVTRALTLTLANATFPSGGTVTLTGVAGTSGGSVFLRVEPL